MVDEVFRTVAVVITAILGIAILSVIVAPRSQTAEVIRSAGDAFSGMLRTIMNPAI
jgi:hypothetical protein